MRFKFQSLPINKAAIAAAMLLVTGIVAAQTVTTVNLTAQRMVKTLPDGTVVPMWGYCTDDPATGGGLNGATLQNANPCSTATTNPAAPATNRAWAPGPTIVVPTRNELKIVLNNNIAAGTSTSLVILGQIGGSAGSPTRDAAAVVHPSVGTTTWNANTPAPAGPFQPPTQGLRARAFAQEAAFGGSVTYTWNANISTTPNRARYLKPGTYLYETGSHPSLQAPMGLYGILVVTETAEEGGFIAFPGAFTGPQTPAALAPFANVPYYRDAKLLFSEIDAVQNVAVDAAAVAQTPETVRWNDPRCIASQQTPPANTTQVACYPAAVNYAPTYFMVNGMPYDQANPAASSVAVQVASEIETSGGMLVRLVNAGLRTHVPTFVGSTLVLIAEDGNVAPGVPKFQSEVNMPAAKTIDALLQPNSPSAARGGGNNARNAATLSRGFPYRNRNVVAFFDRALGLSTGNLVTGGLQGYLVFTSSAATGSALSSALNTNIQQANLAPAVAAKANPDTYTLSPNATTFSADVLANDISVTNVTIQGATTPVAGANSTSLVLADGSTVVLNTNGMFSWTAGAAPPAVTIPPTARTPDTFTYCGLPAGSCALVTLTFETTGGPPTAVARTYDNTATTAYPSNVASVIKVPGGAGLLVGATDPSNFPLTAAIPAGSTAPAWLALKADGSFIATPCQAVPATCTFNFVAVNSQGTASVPVAATVVFPAGSGMKVNLVDALSGQAASGDDYNWIIEEDQTFHNPTPGVTPPYVAGTVPPPSLATSFHRAHSPIVAAGCTGPLSCSDAQTYSTVAANPNKRSRPEDVVLDGTKYYYVSVLPGDAANPVLAGVSGDPLLDPNCGGKSPAACGHTMSGTAVAPLAVGVLSYSPQTVKLEPNPLKPSQLSIFIFEDSAPTNGDPDALEHGLGGFEIVVNDVAGRSGDPVGQITYDAFNMPLTNALLGSPGCPNDYSPTPSSVTPANKSYAGKDLTGVIITCPNDPQDATGGGNPRPEYALQGMALIKNIMPGRFDVIAHAGAPREGAGEKWYQVSTLEGTPGQDAFSKSGEPAYFQEFGPPGFHTFIGFLNPAHIAIQNEIATHPTASAAALESGESLEQLPNDGGPALAVTSVTGRITSLHMSRPIMETLWDSGSRDPLAQTTCFVGLNQAGETGINIGFNACDSQGNFKLDSIPVGSYMLVIWDQWLDQIIAYKSVEVTGSAAAPLVPTGPVAMGDIPVFSWFTRLETNTFVDQNGDGIRNNGDPGIAQVPVTVRFRDGSISNRLLTDADGNAVFTELFPLFNWYVVESDRTRFAGTGVDVTVDAGGLPDCVTYTGTGTNVAVTTGNAASGQPCNKTGGILNSSFVWTNPVTGAPYGAVPAGASTSTNRIDPGTTRYEGLQGYVNQTQILNWGKRPFNPGETGGVQGMVVYASTRGFDDPSLEVQFLWEPGVPRVKLNLFQEIQNADGTTGLKLIDSTLSTSWDDYANGTTATGAPNMVCPGQDSNDPFLTYTLGTANQFKCYDGFHLWNQVQPAVYDGAYAFPTAACDATVCTKGMLPPGKYVVESVLPPGYEVVKEEDKNILIGDAWVAPVAQQFGNILNIFISPDQASVLASYNPNNANNQTTSLGFTGAKTQLPACVGTVHPVPDFMSLFPGSGQVAPFAGAPKPLCDRKEIVLADQMTAGANFFVFSTTPRASHFTGLILDDAATEINAASPDFGEKFALSYAPVSLKDFNGIEVSRVYSDQWGTYNGVIFSSWQVNVPNPAGYSPNMLVTCMNDPGPIVDTRATIVANGVTIANPSLGKVITDPLYNPSFSNFCYTNPFMPGLTVYLDTPVLPVAAFADGYNPPDCAYPDTTPAISRVDGDAVGPWVAAADGTHTVTIKSRGMVDVPNPAYQGPSANSFPFNSRTVTRNYGFGSVAGSVQIGSVALTNVNWSDSQITATVPAGAATGELKIVAASGRASVDTVTVTIEANTPQVVEPIPFSPVAGTFSVAGIAHPIQNAIDAAKPGDLIILDAGSYPELVIMWKPVRLQGVGAASAIINAAKYPTQKLEEWRPVINKLFGINATTHSGNGTADNPAIGELVPNPQVDPLPTQLPITAGIILLEPTILATEEGAGVTVLAKNFPLNACAKDANGNYLDKTANSDSAYYMPSATNNGIVSAVTLTDTGWKMGDSNFLCAASRIDGLTITGSDAGGGIYANGWAHNLEISNNEIYGNASAMHGGIRIASPFEEEAETPPGDRGYNYDINVNIHHNAITKNGTVEATPGVNGAANQTGSGAAISICTGTDNYLVNYNFICGNYSNGNAGGIGVLGASLNGKITHNSVMFNQSYQQMANVHGGGISVEGDQTAAGNLSNGTGNVLIDSNLIVGNFAKGGHGGGIQLAHINGNDVIANPGSPNKWYRATVTNNIITDNVAGYSGGGIYLVDALNARIHDNTIANNDSVGLVGSLFGTGGRGPTTAYPSAAGISTDLTSNAIVASLPSATAGNYRYSNPELFNDIIWHNRSFFLDARTGSANLCSSNSVADAGTNCTVLPDQATIGQCTGTPAYWDLGAVGDASAAASSASFATSSSVLSSTGDPGFVNGYCNGSRANPAFKFEPGQPFLPPFSLAPGITLDEAGNFADLRYGPLQPTGDYHLAGAAGAAYASGAATAAVSGTAAAPLDYDGNVRPDAARTASGANGYDIGALQFNGVPPVPGQLLVTPALAFAAVHVTPCRSATVGPCGAAVQNVTVANPGKTPLVVTGVNVTGPGFTLLNRSTGFTVAPGAVRMLAVRFTANTANAPGTPSVGVLAVNAAAPAASVTVALSGMSIAPSLSVSAPALNFASARGVASAAQTIAVRSSGSAPLSIHGILLRGQHAGQFALSTTCPIAPATLAVGSTCTVSVNFLAKRAGTSNADVAINVAAPAQHGTVALSGTVN